MKKISVTMSTWIALTVLWSASALGAEQYSSGHGALEFFDPEGMTATPLWIKVWLAFLISTFAVGLIFFAWRRPIARWAAGGLIVSMTVGNMVFEALGLPTLSGSIAISHIVCWTPALVLLIIQRPFLNPDESMPFRIWSGVMTGVILFSFVFDVRDAAIYIHHINSLA